MELAIFVTDQPHDVAMGASFWTAVRLTIRMLISKSIHIGSATSDNVKTSDVGVMIAATMRMSTMAWRR